MLTRASVCVFTGGGLEQRHFFLVLQLLALLYGDLCVFQQQVCFGSFFCTNVTWYTDRHSHTASLSDVSLLSALSLLFSPRPPLPPSSSSSAVAGVHHEAIKQVVTVLRPKRSPRSAGSRTLKPPQSHTPFTQLFLICSSACACACMRVRVCVYEGIHVWSCRHVHKLQAEGRHANLLMVVCVDFSACFLRICEEITFSFSLQMTLDDLEIYK